MKLTKYKLCTPKSLKNIFILIKYCYIFLKLKYKKLRIENMFIRTCGLIKYLLKLKLNHENIHLIIVIVIQQLCFKKTKSS